MGGLAVPPGQWGKGWGVFKIPEGSSSISYQLGQDCEGEPPVTVALLDLMTLGCSCSPRVRRRRHSWHVTGRAPAPKKLLPQTTSPVERFDQPESEILRAVPEGAGDAGAVLRVVGSGIKVDVHEVVFERAVTALALPIRKATRRLGFPIGKVTFQDSAPAAGAIFAKSALRWTIRNLRSLGRFLKLAHGRAQSGRLSLS